MKKPFIYLLSAGLAVSMIANTSTTYAATSDANVTFTAPDTEGPVAPLNPEDINQPLNPGEEDGNTTGETGPLTLDYVSHLNFGDEPLDLANTADLEINAVTSNPSLQVSDRRQTGEGWNVTASLSSFVNNSTNSLNGATIILRNGLAASPLGGLQAPNVTNTLELTSDNIAATVVNANGVDASNILNTAQGLGTWVTSWLGTEGENENVLLTVPARTATAGDHSAEITWTLTSGPAN